MATSMQFHITSTEKQSISCEADVICRLSTAETCAGSSCDDNSPSPSCSPLPKIVDVTSRLCTAFHKSNSDDDLADSDDALVSMKSDEDTPIFSVNMLLGYRNSMRPEDAEDSGPVMVCQAKLQPTTYESAASKSKVIAPVRHHQSLTPTAGSWSLQHRNTSGSNLDDNEKVARAARSILNKITVETFDPLFEQLVTCGIEQPAHISKLMSEVFDTATKQHHFIPMYADLCVKLEQDPRIAAVVEVSGHQHNFRRLLLNQCQAVFEQLLEPCDTELAADEEVCLRRKQEALGNIKLIGHLLVNGMLSSKLLVDCAEELISKRATCQEAVESLAALMMVAAPTFDTLEWQYQSKLIACFSSMRKLTKDKTLVPRSRFLLRDVLDVREAGWPTSTKNSAVLMRDPLAQSDEQGAYPTQKDEPHKMGAPVRCGTPEAADSFDLKAFRRNLAAILADLTSDRNVSNAVKRVRNAQVPWEWQAEQFSDLITRIVEEKRGPPRRCALAFAAGLAAADEQSAFDREQCLVGLVGFFQDVYPDLCNEVPRLPAIIRSELTPTFCSVFPQAEINSRLPPGVRF
jgi:hypothetical protein